MSVSHSGVYPVLGRELSKRLSSKKLSTDDPFRDVDNDQGEPFLDWKHPLNVHPWYFAHQALRADFKDNLAALDKMIAAIEIGVYCRYNYLGLQFSA